jgi:hypothetical protein
MLLAQAVIPSVSNAPERRLVAAAHFIGRVDSGMLIIVFGAAGMAMPAGRGRRRAAVWAVAMAHNGHAV